MHVKLTFKSIELCSPKYKTYCMRQLQINKISKTTNDDAIKQLLNSSKTKKQ